MEHGDHPRIVSTIELLRRLFVLDASLSCFQHCTYSCTVNYYIPRPRCNIDRALARRLWPDLIMQPHPVSEVNPSGSISWLLRRTESVIAGLASGLLILGIGVKFDR